jgi:peroxin-16
MHFLATLSATNKGSSRPLITALIMEMISRNLRRMAPVSAALERAEYSRRDRDMLWYLLRGFIWEEYTRYLLTNHISLPLWFNDIFNSSPKIDIFADSVAHTPLLGLFGTLVKDWMPLIDEYYYCS